MILSQLATPLTVHVYRHFVMLRPRTCSCIFVGFHGNTFLNFSSLQVKPEELGGSSQSPRDGAEEKRRTGEKVGAELLHTLNILVGLPAQPERQTAKICMK